MAWPVLSSNEYDECGEEKFTKILPWLGQLQLHMSMMNAIYKRYHRNEPDKLIVIADAVAAGSVGHTLRGKHYQRGLGCLSASYECLLFQLLKVKSVLLLYEVQKSCISYAVLEPL